MKSLTKASPCKLILFTVFSLFIFSACQKQIDQPSNPQEISSATPPPFDSLSGTEIIFDTLIWESGDFFGLGINDVFVGTPARQDLFVKSRSMEVSIKFDTSSVWILVPSWTSGIINPTPPLPPNNSYTYEFFNSVLYVFAFPLNYQLTGTKVSIKVKFL